MPTAVNGSFPGVYSDFNPPLSASVLFEALRFLSGNDTASSLLSLNP